MGPYWKQGHPLPSGRSKPNTTERSSGRENGVLGSSEFRPGKKDAGVVVPPRIPLTAGCAPGGTEQEPVMGALPTPFYTPSSYSLMLTKTPVGINMATLCHNE